jgi:hypothetical protein
MSGGGDVLFREVQRFRQLWIKILFVFLWAAVVGIQLLVIVLVMTSGGSRQAVPGILLSSLPGVVIVGAVTWLIFAASLTTEVRRDGLYIRFYPFHLSWKQIPLVNIVRVEARTYRPVAEYGGWGLRCSWNLKGRAYNVSGNRGVRIDYADGTHVLIGSGRADDLARAVASILSHASRAGCSAGP